MCEQQSRTCMQELAAAAAGNEVPVVRDVTEDSADKGGLPGLVSLPLRGRNWCKM